MDGGCAQAYTSAMLHQIPLRLPILTAVLALCGCSTAQTRLHNVVTVHDPQATRVWVIEDIGGEHHVVLCDVAMLRETRTLCMRGNIAPAPATMPVMVPMMPPALPPAK